VLLLLLLFALSDDDDMVIISLFDALSRAIGVLSGVRDVESYKDTTRGVQRAPLGL
jgi:hypothetical protein